MDLINHKSSIAEQLNEKRNEIDHEIAMMLIYTCSFDGIIKQQTMSLSYAYHHNYDDLKKIISNNKEIVAVRTNGNYSAIGVSLIKGENTNYEKQKECIQKLFGLGFIPTDEDKKLARLVWLQQVNNNKKNNIPFLFNSRQTCMFSILPYELIKTITWYLIEPKKPLF